ncbi:hypothetical protein SUGI_1002300 [Cryptomeria japonica]|nr:hypothetical protein SUGI_1002300 [Cryptomeria japonica]
MGRPALQKPLDINGRVEGFAGNLKGRLFAEAYETVVDLMEELEEDRQFLEEQVVIASIIGLNWSRKNIRLWVEEKWGEQIVIKVIPKCFFVVLFENHSERDHILNQENWFTDKHVVYLQPWTPNFNPITLAVYSCPKWIEIEKEIHHCPRCDSKFHGEEECRMLFRKARNPFRRSTQIWRLKLEKMVSDSVAKNQEIRSPLQQQKKGSVSSMKVREDPHSENKNVDIHIFSIKGGESSR